jgi:hypothetical protein
MAKHLRFDCMYGMGEGEVTPKFKTQRGDALKILVACEYSGTVREALTRKGHHAMSCDLLETEIQGWHYKGNILDVLNDSWDMMIGFPPCTDLAVSGAKHFWYKRENGSQQRSIDFFMKLVNAPIERIAIENPIGIMSTIYRKPDQIIQPWQFGHGETKSTCLWLKGLPKLKPENIVEGREQRIWAMPPSKDRAKKRSLTYSGIAQAMANQWSNLSQLPCAVGVLNSNASPQKELWNANYEPLL